MLMNTVSTSEHQDENYFRSGSALFYTEGREDGLNASIIKALKEALIKQRCLIRANNIKLRFLCYFQINH